MVILFSVAIINLKGAAYYISTSGNDTLSGGFDDPFLTFRKAASLAEPGDTIFIRGGIYSNNTSIVLNTKSGKPDSLIHVLAYEEEVPVFNFSAMAENSSNRGFILDADYWHFKGIIIEETGDNGMLLAGNNNIIESCIFRKNHDTGLQLSRYNTNANSIAMWPSYNLILNCESYDNKDSDNEDADGFAAKLTCGEGNVFKGCISHHNIDDGWDMYTKTSTGPIGAVTLIECISHDNGVLTDGVTSGNGDKNGFKLGGEDIPVNHIVRRCIAFNNGKHGFTYNRNLGTIDFSNNTAYNNAERNFNFDGGTSVFSNNLSFMTGSNDRIIGTDAGKNAWDNDDAFYTVTTDDFVTLVPGPDNDPTSNGFLNLSAGSQFIDEGLVLHELSFNGLAPDLGAIESEGNPAKYLEITIIGSGSVTPESGYYTANDSVIVTATPDEFYYFAGWSGDTVSGEIELKIVMNSDKTITAQFGTNMVTLEISITGSGSVEVEPEKEVYEIGETVTLTAVPANDSWTFSKYSGNISTNDNPYSFTVDSDMQVETVFEKLSSIRNHNDRELTVFPNPVKDILKVKLSEYEFSNCSLQIRDLHGKIVYSAYAFNKDEIYINLSNLPEGIYMIKVTSGDEIYINRIIKQ